METFLIDRQAAGRAKKTLRFYRQYLKAFTAHCEAHTVRLIDEITPDFLRRYLVELAATHNPGGVHGYYRALRAFLRNGGDIFTLQKLMGHADLAVLKRYLKLSDQDAQRTCVTRVGHANPSNYCPACPTSGARFVGRVANIVSPSVQAMLS